MLEKLTHKKIMRVPLSLAKSVAPWKGIVIALFLQRGGHFASIKELFHNNICGPIPQGIIALHVQRIISSENVDELIIVYHRAKRYKEEQLLDLLKLVELIRDLTGKKVYTIAYPSKIVCRDNQLIIPLSMGPGAIKRDYEKTGCNVASSLMETSMDLIISWILGCINSFR